MYAWGNSIFTKGNHESFFKVISGNMILQMIIIWHPFFKKLCTLTLWIFCSHLWYAISLKQQEHAYLAHKGQSPYKDVVLPVYALATVLTWESPYLGKTVFILRRGPDSCDFIGIPGKSADLTDTLSADRVAYPVCQLIWVPHSELTM